MIKATELLNVLTLDFSVCTGKQDLRVIVTCLCYYQDWEVGGQTGCRHPLHPPRYGWNGRAAGFKHAQRHTKREHNADRTISKPVWYVLTHCLKCVYLNRVVLLAESRLSDRPIHYNPSVCMCVSNEV